MNKAVVVAYLAGCFLIGALPPAEWTWQVLLILAAWSAACLGFGLYYYRKV